MLFHPSNSISNIRLNIFSFHSLVLILIGVTLLILSSITDSFGSSGENQIYGLIAIVLGVISLYFISKKKAFIVLFNLIILGAVLLADLFINSDSNYVNTIIISSFIVFLPIVNIFYGIKKGLIVMALLIAVVWLRYYLSVNEILSVKVVINSGWFDVTIYSIFTMYSLIVFGYYSSTIQDLVYENSVKEIVLKQQLEKYNRKRMSISDLLKEVDHLILDHDSEIKKRLFKAKVLLEQSTQIDYRLLQEVGDEVSTDLDFILKTINDKIEHLEAKKNV